jgi:glyoxylase-like metal-dependent hydrolase (beta-lactamase superfamily II)
MNTFLTDKGAQIYQLSLHEFPGLVGNVYFVVTGKYRVLIDTGSGFGESNQDLVRGLEEVSEIRNEDCSLNTINHVFITHGHIDHFGGLSYIKERSDAKICIHELDRRIVSNHQERLSIAAHRLDEFLTEAGLPDDIRQKEIELYKITKSLYRSVDVDLTYESIGMRIGPFKFFHVPGHCAGHVLIKLHEILFTGDHILDKTSPHQAPEQITLSTGLETYLHSLEKTRPLAEMVKLSLGGHEGPIIDLEKRIEEIRLVHRERLQRILNILADPHVINDISKYLFGKVDGYTVLLALEETGAHVEYLYQRGFLQITNLNELEDDSRLVPILYQCIDCKIKKI